MIKKWTDKDPQLSRICHFVVSGCTDMESNPDHLCGGHS